MAENVGGVKMTYVIAARRGGYEKLANKIEQITNSKCYLIHDSNQLTTEFLNKLQPKFIFFPHWSEIIPEEIFERFESIVFHMTDVPYGRGGSPLQNLISRGIYETKISAIRCVKELDAGAVYLKKNFSLYGNAEEIYLRAERVISDMILEIIEKQPVPVVQEGEVVYFSRRKPHQSNIENLASLEKLFDHIRMLDAEGYPKAYLETPHFRMEFQRASLRRDRIIADVIITPKEKEKYND